jgi:hypothetical protein
MSGESGREPSACGDLVGLRVTSLLVWLLPALFVMDSPIGMRTDFEVHPVIASRNLNESQEALSEERIRLEIAYYEDRIAEIGGPTTPHEWGLLNNYRTLVSFHRKLLTALRAGRPHAWMDYPEATEEAPLEGGPRPASA